MLIFKFINKIMAKDSRVKIYRLTSDLKHVISQVNIPLYIIILYLIQYNISLFSRKKGEEFNVT